MERKTRFTFGSKVCVIKNGKVHEFEVKSIILGAEAIFYSEDEPGHIIFESYPEDQCFGSRQELCDYILGNG